MKHRDNQPICKANTGTAARRSLLGVVVALTACGAGDLALRDTAVPGPTVAHVDSSYASGPVPTRALHTEGDQRIAEPTDRRQRREADGELHPLVMPLAERPYLRIDSHAKGSISVGTVTSGFLVDGASFEPEGPYHKVLDKVADRQTRFTTDEMKALLSCAAQRVGKQYPGHKMHLGNLARMGGGTLPWSVSHHNGRDADLAFYVRTPRGRIAEPDQMYHFNGALEATDAPTALRFDVAANWALVKALATCPGPDIQYLFIANWLKAPIIAWAHKNKEDKAVIAKVAAILHQPHGALPHNDHLHLRIACSRDDATEGCLDASRAPAEAIGRTPSVQARLPAVRKALRDSDADRRIGALRLLTLYRDFASVPALLATLADPVPAVRRAGLEAMAEWRPAGTAEAIAQAADRESDAGLLAVQLRTLAILDPAAMVPRFHDLRLVTSTAFDTPNVAVRQLAVDLLSESASLDVARACVPLLADGDAQVREAARRTLGRIVNRTTADLLAAQDPSPFTTVLAPEAERQLWFAFLDRVPEGTSRDAIALAGLQERGVMVRSLDRAALPQLVQALALPSPFRDNAARWIERVVGMRFSPGQGARATPAAFWPQWLTQKRMVSAAVMASVLPGAGAMPVAADADAD